MNRPAYYYNYAADAKPMFKFLLLSRRECERDRIPYEPSFLHLLPVAVIEHILIPSLRYLPLPCLNDHRLRPTSGYYDRFAGVRHGIGSGGVDSDAGLSQRR